MQKHKLSRLFSNFLEKRLNEFFLHLVQILPTNVFFHISKKTCPSHINLHSRTVLHTKIKNPLSLEFFFPSGRCLLSELPQRIWTWFGHTLCGVCWSRRSLLVLWRWQLFSRYWTNVGWKAGHILAYLLGLYKSDIFIGKSFCTRTLTAFKYIQKVKYLENYELKNVAGVYWIVKIFS